MKRFQSRRRDGGGRAGARVFSRHDGAAALGVARAGNVIGGGDWGEDRLVPDILRAAGMKRRSPWRLRYPDSTRPWQHVLDVIAGYESHARKLVLTTKSGGALPKRRSISVRLLTATRALRSRCAQMVETLQAALSAGNRAGDPFSRASILAGKDPAGAQILPWPAKTLDGWSHAPRRRAEALAWVADWHRAWHLERRRGHARLVAWSRSRPMRPCRRRPRNARRSLAP